MQSFVKKTALIALLSLLPALALAQQSDPAPTNTPVESGGGKSEGTGQKANDKADEDSACHSDTFNPMKDPDWNNLYPITIMGARFGDNTNPAMMSMPPICVCPGPFNIPSFGVGITFWEPLYISEIERTPGCLTSMGGKQILKDYKSLQSEQINEGDNGGPTSRMQVHWYQYPVMTVLDIMKGIACKTISGFNLLYMTEIDSTWQDDEWAAVYAPEATLFTSPLAQASCGIDAVASALGQTLDPMFWCAGTWGSVYPFTGNAAHTNSNFTSNNLVQAKFIARQSRIGAMFTTIGPSARCFAHPNPIWVKSQYRVNQVSPMRRVGAPVVIGDPGLRQKPIISNYPTRESTVNLIWQGQQCCARIY